VIYGSPSRILLLAAIKRLQVFEGRFYAAHQLSTAKKLLPIAIHPEY
jgi:hypothetical protein